MNFMRDDNGVPHPTTCGIFTEKKVCTCRKPAEAKLAQDMIAAAAMQDNKTGR